MNHPIAQLVALATHGNAHIVGTPRFEEAAFFPGNSTFQFCEFVRFVEAWPARYDGTETEYAADPLAWFKCLTKEGIVGLRLHHASTAGLQVGGATVSDRMLVAFVGGGGRWLIKAIKPNGADLWEARWQVGDQQRADRKIWRVSYVRTAKRQAISPTLEADHDELKRRLADCLTAIGAFARRHDLGGFADAFDAGLSQLNSQEPGRGVRHTDLVPAGALPLSAAQLLYAAQAAWVFGGMGSWNDLAFSGPNQGEYERLSDELFQLIHAAIVSGANAGAPSMPMPAPKPWWKLWG